MKRKNLLLICLFVSYYFSAFSQETSEKFQSIKLNVLSSLATIPLGGFMCNASYEQSTRYAFNAHFTFQYFTEDLNPRPHQFDIIFEPRFYDKSGNSGFHIGPYLRYYLLSHRPNNYSYGALGGVTGYKFIFSKKVEMDLFGGTGLALYQPGGRYLDDITEFHENEHTASKLDFRIGVNLGYVLR